MPQKLDIQPLDIQPLADDGGENSLDIQPLDIQPIESPTQKSTWATVNTPLSDIGSRTAKKVSDFILDPTADASQQWFLTPRAFIAGAAKGAGDIVDSLTSPLGIATTLLTAGSGAAAKTGLPIVARGLMGAASAPAIAHGGGQILDPESSLSERAWGTAELAGGLAGLKTGVKPTKPKVQPKPTAIVPEILPPEQITNPTRLLEAPVDPYIGGVDGRLQRRSLLNPQEEARLAGYDIDANGNPVPAIGEPAHFGVDLGELREQNRQAGLNFTDFEQQGGVPLIIADKPNMASPPVAGDTRLGFNPTSSANLPYPLNVVPEAVRPRSAQAVTQALAGDDLSAPIVDKPKLEFGDELARPLPEKVPERDMMGGTAPVMEGEQLLPSAPKKPSRVSQRQIKQEGLNEYPDKVNSYVEKNLEPVAPGASKAANGILNRIGEGWNNFANGALISIERQLEKMGQSGQEIRKALSTAEYRKREIFNQRADQFIKITSRLTKDEVTNFVDAIEGNATPISENVATAVALTKKLTSELGNDAELAGVRLKTTDNQVVPFKLRENYWPRKPVNRPDSKAFIEELLQRNPSMTREQALQLSKEYLEGSEHFSSAQHARNPGQVPFEYRKDLGAMLEHIADMADNIARAEVLGAGDIGVKGTMINRLIDSTPDPSRTHDLVRSHLRGAMDKNDDFYRALKSANRMATRSQVFTKLGLFTISAFNNQLATLLHGNIAPFAKSFAHTLRGSQLLKDVAKEYGTVAIGEIPANILAEAGRKPVPVVGNMVTWAENIQRTIATGTGIGTAKALFKSAKSGNKMSQKRLANLMLEDVSEILKQKELDPDQLKFATQRFVEISQQLDAGYKLPPIWNNEPMLHIPLIFKKFAFQGTKTLKDAMVSNPGRNIPLFLMASPIFGELTGDAKAIVTGAVRGAIELDSTILDGIAYELRNRGNFAGKVTQLEGESDSEWLVNRLAADYVQSWGLGLMGDMMQAALEGDSGWLSFLGGPAIEQGTKLVTDVLQGDLENIGRESLRSVPMIGPGLQKGLLPYQSQEMD